MLANWDDVKDAAWLPARIAYEDRSANRDGLKVYSLAEVERERRSGYRWYGDFATRR